MVDPGRIQGSDGSTKGWVTQRRASEVVFLPLSSVVSATRSKPHETAISGLFFVVQQGSEKALFGFVLAGTEVRVYPLYSSRGASLGTEG